MKYLFTLIYLALLIVPVIFWYDASGTALSLGIENGNANPIIYAIAKLAGLVGFAMMLLQLPMAAKFRWLEQWFGQDKLMRFHRVTGIIGVLLVMLIHVPLLDLFQYRIGGFEQLKNFFFNGPIEQKIGSMSLVLLTIVFVVSLFNKQLRIPYHWFKRIHFLTYIAVVGGFIHSIGIGTDLAEGKALRIYWMILFGIAVIAIVYRWIIRPMMKRQYVHEVIEVRDETNGVRSIVLKPLKKSISYMAGQFAYVQFLNKKQPSAEWHPFTLSSSPTEEHLMITPKELGDWTKQLGSISKGDKLYMEAPFGRFSYTSLPANRNAIVMIAGGIGITPMRSMLKAIADSGNDAMNVELLYGNRTEADIAFRQELDTMAQAEHITVHHVLSKQEDWAGPKGRVDKAMIEQLVENIASKDVFVCGPPPMMRAVIATLTELGVPAKQIHSEQFSLK